jgi:transcriptional regulator of acetoin/glycerol metabolism
MERLEREYLLSTLERSRWQQGTTAATLGINRRTIHRKLKRYREQGFLPVTLRD